MARSQGIALTAEQARVFDSACSLLRDGKLMAALEIALRLEVQAPMAVDTLHLLGMCHAELGNVALAEYAFESALMVAPTNFTVLMNYAAWLNRMGRSILAQEVLQRAAKAAPEVAQPRIQLGLLALDAKDYVRAEMQFRQALRRDSKAVLAWHGLGNALRERGELSLAEDAFNQAILLSPNYGPAWVNLGGVQRMRGLSKDALASYEQARILGQRGPELEDAINGTLVDCGQVAQAVEGAKRLASSYPGYAPGQTTLARLLWEYGGQDDPLASFEKAARAQPQNRPLHLHLIRALLEARCIQRALEYAQSLHRRDKSDLLAQWLLADCYLQVGQVEIADSLYGQVYQHLSNAPNFLNAYTRFFLSQKRWGQAEQVASHAVKLDVDNQEGWANLSIAWRMLNDPREHWLCDYDRLIGIVDIDTPPGYANVEVFLQALKVYLDTIHVAKRAPINQSVRGGSQTKGNLFGCREPVINAAHAILKKTAENWLKTLPDDTLHPFLARKPPSGRIGIAGSWSVKLWSSGHHSNHVHPHGWISSAFYVDLPPSIVAQPDSEYAGYIQFGQPLDRFGLHLPARRVVRPSPGKLVLFPSYFWHGTVPFVDDVPRLTIAFDMRRSK